MTSERKGLPSASELHRVAGCAGFLALRAQLGPKPESKSEDALSGQRVHAAYALWEDTPDYAKDYAALGLSLSEEDCLDRARYMTRELVAAHNFEDAQELREMRLFLDDPATASTGKFDRCYKLPNRILVIDLKTGRDPVPAVERNYQMRHYGLLSACNFFAEPYAEGNEVLVAVVQPWVSGKPEVARYGREELRQAYVELAHILRVARVPGAPRKVGDHCGYCECLEANACPEARAASLPELATRPDASQLVTLLSPEQLGEFLNAAAYADEVFEAARGVAKLAIQAGQNVPGWSLGKGRELTKITDPELVFTRASEAGVSQKAFLGCISVGKEKLMAALKAATSLKGKKLEDAYDELMAGCPETKVSERPLVRVK